MMRSNQSDASIHQCIITFAYLVVFDVWNAMHSQRVFVSCRKNRTKYKSRTDYAYFKGACAKSIDLICFVDATENSLILLVLHPSFVLLATLLFLKQRQWKQWLTMMRSNQSDASIHQCIITFAYLVVFDVWNAMHSQRVFVSCRKNRTKYRFEI